MRKNCIQARPASGCLTTFPQKNPRPISPKKGASRLKSPISSDIAGSGWKDSAGHVEVPSGKLPPRRHNRPGPISPKKGASRLKSPISSDIAGSGWKDSAGNVEVPSGKLPPQGQSRPGRGSQSENAGPARQIVTGAGFGIPGQ